MSKETGFRAPGIPFGDARPMSVLDNPDVVSALGDQVERLGLIDSVVERLEKFSNDQLKSFLGEPLPPVEEQVASRDSYIAALKMTGQLYFEKQQNFRRTLTEMVVKPLDAFYAVGDSVFFRATEPGAADEKVAVVKPGGPWAARIAQTMNNGVKLIAVGAVLATGSREKAAALVENQAAAERGGQQL